MWKGAWGQPWRGEAGRSHWCAGDASASGGPLSSGRSLPHPAGRWSCRAQFGTQQWRSTGSLHCNSLDLQLGSHSQCNCPKRRCKAARNKRIVFTLIAPLSFIKTSELEWNGTNLNGFKTTNYMKKKTHQHLPHNNPWSFGGRECFVENKSSLCDYRQMKANEYRWFIFLNKSATASIM